MFEAVQTFLTGVMAVLHALLLPTDPITGAISWAQLPAQPLKLLVWAALLFAFLPGVFRVLVAPLAQAGKQTTPTAQAKQAAQAAQRQAAQRQAEAAAAAQRQAEAAAAAQRAAIAAQERRQAERAAQERRQAEQAAQRQQAEHARQAALEAQQRQPTTTPAQVGKKAKGRSTGRTLMTDAGELVEGITERRRKTHALYRVDGGYALATTDGRMVASFTTKDDGMAALDAAAPTKQKPRKATKKDAPQAAPNAADRSHARAFGSDPSRIYAFRYRVVELDELIASNTDQGGVNPAYDQTLQPRQRDRAASQRQIEQMAQNLVPEAYLWDFKALDKGAPIIGSDMMVESGNGRTLALRRAAQQGGERWQDYRAQLEAQASDLGIAGELDGKAAPVLVRERITEVDRTAFAREANSAPILQMSPLELAKVDASRIDDAMLLRLQVKEDQSIDKALRAAANREFVGGFMRTLSENERAMLLRRNGTLNQMGIWRMKAALFTRAFPGEAGERIADTFLEALDSDTKNFESAISGTLPRISRAQGLISSGQRATDLDISGDVSTSLDMLARLRETGMLPQHYVEQSNMFERELTPFQERLLLHFDAIGRKPKQIRQFFNAYADLVEDAPHPDQGDMFGGGAGPSKDDLLSRIIQQQESTA
jgi:hypothetical protein